MTAPKTLLDVRWGGDPEETCMQVVVFPSLGILAWKVFTLTLIFSLKYLMTNKAGINGTIFGIKKM